MRLQLFKPEFKPMQLDPPRVDPLPRLCEADGETCIFHRWVDEDKALLRINVMMQERECKLLNEKFKADGIVLPGCFTEVVRRTLALVEFPDGTVKKVDPEAVRFLDREETNT